MVTHIIAGANALRLAPAIGAVLPFGLIFCSSALVTAARDTLASFDASHAYSSCSQTSAAILPVVGLRRWLK